MSPRPWRRLRGLSRPPWLNPSELRIGLGCMRLSDDDGPEEELALETIAAAVRGGVTVFDTARAYGHGENEGLLARGLRRAAGEARARIVTKGGMTRAGGAWLPDGRARAIRADCEASLAALDGLPIDLYLLHAPDPRTPWSTSVRALARLLGEGLVARVGLANVDRRRLDEALELVPVAAVQVALSPFDDRALRGGLVARCADLGIAVIAHSPLGGVRRAPALARRPALAEIARSRGSSPPEVALAWLLGLSPAVVAIPGARRPETASSAARAAALELDGDEREALARALGRVRPAHAVRRRRAREHAEAVIVMGIPGAGKSRIAEAYVARGYRRLNRDERAGSLRQLAEALDEALAGGERRVVLDNTYATRAARNDVVEAAARHGVRTRCVWLDTPLAQAQVNVVERLLDRFGALPMPEELRGAAAREPGVLLPTSQMRVLRELEPPGEDEGFAAVERVPFERRPVPGRTRPGVLVAAAALRSGLGAVPSPGDRGAPHLVFDWWPGGAVADLAAEVEPLVAGIAAPVEVAVCPHAAGPPRCWCRPPLPGLAVAFARAHGVDLARSVLVGTGPAHRTLATALGARWVAVRTPP
ncbi:MAG: aldo/keto reductase [Pseudomonadota bacterium]